MKDVSRILIFAGLLAPACGPGANVNGEGDTDVVFLDDVASSAAVFAPDRLLEVAIEMDPDDWDTLRHQTRSLFDIVGSSCLEPPVRPFTYFSADVTVDGETITEVAVRKKGFFGSLDTERPSLKISFNEYVPGRRYSGVKRLTLNNNKSDPSNVKQCIGYRLFADAGVTAPRCNFAVVTVNGVDLGVYTNVESLKKDFLRRNYADPDGNLYEGALSDFRIDWVDTFQKKTNQESPDRSDIEALVPVMQSEDADLLVAMAPYIDVDRFVVFWAMELIVGHLDGYARNTNNFYVYHDPTTGQLDFIPWGIDAIMHAFDGPLPWEEVPAPKIIWSEGILARRLFHLSSTQADYLASIQDLLDAHWDEAALNNEIDRMYALFVDHVPVDYRTRFDDAVGGVRVFIDNRQAELEAELAAQVPVLGDTYREPWCIDALGTVAGTFDTTWGTVTAADPFTTGTGTLDIVMNEVAFPPGDLVSANSGFDPDSPGAEPIIQVFAFTQPNILRLVRLVIPEVYLVAGSTLSLDWVEASGWAAEFIFPPPGCVPPPGSTECPPTVNVLGMIGGGTVQLDAVETTGGAAVTGSLEATIFEPLAME